MNFKLTPAVCENLCSFLTVASSSVRQAVVAALPSWTSTLLLVAKAIVSTLGGGGCKKDWCALCFVCSKRASFMEKWSKFGASFLWDRCRPPLCAPLPRSPVGSLCRVHQQEHKIGFCYSHEGLWLLSPRFKVKLMSLCWCGLTEL